MLCSWKPLPMFRYRSLNILWRRGKELWRLNGGSGCPYHLEAAAEYSARTKNAMNFPVSCLFVRKSMKAIEGQRQIKAIILKGQRSHIALPKPHIVQVCRLARCRAVDIMSGE